MIVDVLVEGPADEAVARKLIGVCGHQSGVVYGKKGQGYIQAKAVGFNIRAQYGSPILALVDLMDTRLECAAKVGTLWLGDRRSQRMLLRVVVRELESWLLADGDGIADWLGVSSALVRTDPEALDDPKQTLVNLARRSRRRHVHEAIVPAPGLSGAVGPGYVASVQEFIDRRWSVEAAASRAPSLRRCLVRLRELS